MIHSKLTILGQQLIVKATPQRKADVFWEYTCQLIDADYTSILDAASCQAGMTTRFLSNLCLSTMKKVKNV